MIRLSHTLRASVALAFVLAGCAGQSAPLGNTTPSTQSLSERVSVHSPMSVVLHPPTSMLAHHARPPSGTCPKKLLFVSDAASNDINIFPLMGKNQPSCAQLNTGLSQPQGMAADAQRNLYLANTNDSNILVYAGPYPPGKLVRTLDDSGFFPAGVAVAHDGLVAVTNICSAPSCGPGNVTFFAKGKTTACNVVTPSTMSRVYFAGFDSADNLYVDGQDASGFTAGGMIGGGCKAKSMTAVSFGGLQFPGGIAVDTKGNVAVTDQDAGAIDVYTPPNFSTAAFVVTLSGTSDPVEFAFERSGKKLWGTSAGNAEAAAFKYPAGGNPVNTVDGGGEPDGVAVIPVAVPGP